MDEGHPSAPTANQDSRPDEAKPFTNIPESNAESLANAESRDTNFGLIAIPAGSTGASGEVRSDGERSVSNNAAATSTSTTASSTPPADTEPPVFAFAIPECAATISTSGCLIATSTVTISASSTAPDFDRFEIACATSVSSCASFPQTFATSSFTVTAALDDFTAHTFSIRVFDTAGNATTATQTIERATLPVVINEVAWMGTASSSADEWIELYNTTASDIALDEWHIRAADGAPFIALSGSIPAKGYYLIERTSDQTIRDIAADLVVPFSGIGSGSGLEDGGEKLYLDHVVNGATKTMDEIGIQLPLGRWCAGTGAPWRATMERYDPRVSGNDCTNWGTNTEFFRTGHDGSGAAITGTPKMKNSVSYHIANGTTLSNDKTLTETGSPYVVPREGLTIGAGATLTIEPGVVIKIVAPNEPQITVQGTIRAEGTSDAPVVFTAFTDDEYGGDLNGDGICNPVDASSTAACPNPGSWKNMTIEPTSVGSEFHHTIVRYGGRWFTNMPIRASVIVDRTNVVFDHFTVEHSKKHGLYLAASTSTVANSTFKNNDHDADSVGLFAAGGASDIRDSVFRNNRTGLHIENTTIPLSGLVFTDNETALSVASASTTLNTVSFSGNALDIYASGVYSVTCGIGCTASTTVPSVL